MSDDFDWNALDNDERIVRPARETAAYLNSDGDVVIRQRREWPDENEDPFLVIPIHRIPALINRLDRLMLDANNSGADK